MSSNEVLAALFALRKEYDDDREDRMYQALHHACLFISYRIADFEGYLRDTSKGAAASAERNETDTGSPASTEGPAGSV